jgi:hypothetical protein
MAQSWKPPLVEAGRVRTFLSLHYDDAEHLATVRPGIEKIFGKPDYETQAVVKSATIYHKPRKLYKLLSFPDLAAREEITALRKKTLTLEKRHVREALPLVEMDPGYVGEFTVVRTALEEDFHRIYLYGGIFAESLYFFERGSFRPWVHSPEFYRQSDILTFFNDLHMIFEAGRK